MNFLLQQDFKYLQRVQGREKWRFRLAALRGIPVAREEIDAKVPRY